MNEQQIRQPQPQPRVLTIAGSDSGGGAGIQADLKTFTAHDVYGTSVLTVITAQNTKGITGAHAIPPEFVIEQLHAVLSDIGTDAIKIGALSNTGTIRAVGNALRQHFPKITATSSNLVLDPVMVATSGDMLLQKEAVRTMVEELFPITHVLTPNVPEAEALLEELGVSANKIGSLDDMKRAAVELAKHGPCIVVVKGGHLPFSKDNGQAFSPLLPQETQEVVDIVHDTRTGMTIEIRRDFVRTRSTHGTGCTLSAAIAANLALGCPSLEAIEKAIDYVQAAIRHAQPIGSVQGHGPLNHSHALLHRAIELPSAHKPQPFTTHLLRKFAAEWKTYTEHPFVAEIGNGTLPRENFVHYIKQDYLFLQNYARAHGLAAFKCRTLLESKTYAKNVVTIAHETRMHVDFCAKWGVSYEQLLATEESMANFAYTRYVLDIGSTGDILDLCVALAPCLIGYGHIGTRLWSHPGTVKGDAGNQYWDWISIYAGEDYQTAVREGIEKLEQMVREQDVTETRLRRLEKIFVDATRLETEFWEMGMHCK